MINNFMWAVREMKKGNFVRGPSWIKGLYYFMQNEELIGKNPLYRVFLINITNNYKCFGGGYANVSYPSEKTCYFLSDFESKHWISKTFKQIKQEWRKNKNEKI